MKSLKQMYGEMTTPPERPSMGHTKQPMKVADKMFQAEEAKKPKKMASGGCVCRGDGIAQRGKTKGRML